MLRPPPGNGQDCWPLSLSCANRTRATRSAEGSAHGTGWLLGLESCCFSEVGAAAATEVRYKTQETEVKGQLCPVGLDTSHHPSGLRG